jgi:hypothetical protein
MFLKVEECTSKSSLLEYLNEDRKKTFLIIPYLFPQVYKLYCHSLFLGFVKVVKKLDQEVF